MPLTDLQKAYNLLVNSYQDMPFECKQDAAFLISQLKILIRRTNISLTQKNHTNIRPELRITVDNR